MFFLWNLLFYLFVLVVVIIFLFCFVTSFVVIYNLNMLIQRKDVAVAVTEVLLNLYTIRENQKRRLLDCQIESASLERRRRQQLLLQQEQQQRQFFTKGDNNDSLEKNNNKPSIELLSENTGENDFLAKTSAKTSAKNSAENNDDDLAKNSAKNSAETSAKIKAGLVMMTPAAQNPTTSSLIFFPSMKKCLFSVGSSLSLFWLLNYPGYLMRQYWMKRSCFLDIWWALFRTAFKDICQKMSPDLSFFEKKNK